MTPRQCLSCETPPLVNQRREHGGYAAYGLYANHKSL